MGRTEDDTQPQLAPPAVDRQEREEEEVNAGEDLGYEQPIKELAAQKEPKDEKDGKSSVARLEYMKARNVRLNPARARSNYAYSGGVADDGADPSSSSVRSAGSVASSNFSGTGRDTIIERKLRISDNQAGGNAPSLTSNASFTPGAVAVFPMDGGPSTAVHMPNIVEKDLEEDKKEDDKLKQDGSVPFLPTEDPSSEFGTPEGAIAAQVVDDSALEQEMHNRILSGTVDAYATEIDDEVKERQQKLRKIVFFATSLIAAVAVAIGIVVSQIGPSEPTMAPTMSPTALIQSDREQELVSYIQAISLDNGASLEIGRDTPQYRALLNVLETRPDFEEYDRDEIQFRYVLAALYYSTDGPNWLVNENWLTSEPICNWEMICDSCNGCDGSRDGIFHLALAENGLRGVLPEEFGLLPSSVLSIDLSGNELEGYVHDKIFDSVALQSFSISSNAALSANMDLITGLLNCVEIDVSGTNVTGTLPSSLRRISGMKHLGIASTGMTGTLPTSIGYLTRLTTLNVGSTQFTGTIPTEIGLCTDLKYIEMNGRIHGTIPDEFYQLTKLTEIHLQRGAFQGTMSSLIGRLTDLGHLHMIANHFVGSIPTEIGLLTSLTRLRVAFNRFSGQLPSELGQLPVLYQAYLRNNQFSGTLPPEIGNCTAMENLRFNSNRIQGTMPTSITLLSKLQFLYLDNNQFTGALPSLKNLPDLSRSFMNNNNFSGTLPDDMFDWVSEKLITLRLGFNDLTGQIPTSIGQATSLTSLAMDSNALTGTIPTEIGLLSKIGSLSIGDNRLSSALPTEMGMLTSLRFFQGQNNLFTGGIPAQFASIASLESAFLDGNEFTGSAPMCDIAVSFIQTLSADCDEIACDCCTYCCETTVCYDTTTGDVGLEVRNLPTPGPSPAAPLPQGVLEIACNATLCYEVPLPAPTEANNTRR